jgi:putative peptidoglycan lipid II flippase
MLLALSGLTALFIVIAPWVMDVFRLPSAEHTLATGLARVMFPLVALLGVSGIVVGVLNSYDHFTVPAISPVFWNLAIIVGLAIGVPSATRLDAKLYVYAGSILAATFVQVFLPMPWLRGLDRGEERLRVVLDWRDPAVWRVFKLMVPVTLGLGLINVNALIDTFFASATVVGTQFACRLKNARLRSSIRPLKTSPALKAASASATTGVCEGCQAPRW